MSSSNFILRRLGFSLVLVQLFCWSSFVLGTPLKLRVQPRGTNQVVVTISPVITNAYYAVLARTNGPGGHWTKFADVFSESNATVTTVCNLGSVPGLTLGTINNWVFVAGRWDDLGDGLPYLYKELVLRLDPYASVDAYTVPMPEDGWSYLQKMQNGMDPYAVCRPPPLQSFVEFRGNVGTNNVRLGNAILTWRLQGAPAPDYFVVERAKRTPRPRTNDMPFAANGAYGPYPPPFGRTNAAFGRMTNRPPNMLFRGRTNPSPAWATNHSVRWPTNQPMHLATNAFPTRPPSRPPGFWRPPTGPPVIETGPFVEIARVPGRAGVSEYRYVDTNIDTLFQPTYSITAPRVAPYHAYLNEVNTASIRNTVIRVSATPTTNGYALTVNHPIPYAWYLVLVRDRNDPQWRASGYFGSGTNRDAVYLHADAKGMMTDVQKPLAMPPVKFVPDVVQPEFIAGWGEDSDGDGLPDIYEVMVTHTEPDDADTGKTGVLDGFMELTDDGLSNLEKFRRRADPLRAALPPPSVELRQPTSVEVWEALTPKTDFHCDAQLSVRAKGAVTFLPIERVPGLLMRILNYREPNKRRDFDVRVSWQFWGPERLRNFSFANDPPGLGAIEPLFVRVNLELVKSFREHLERNPPISSLEASNITVQLMRTYREGNLDDGVAMLETRLVEDNTAQNMFGKVVDQQGQLVANMVATANVTREGPAVHAKTQTDEHGLFQFVGLRGRSLNISLEKNGYETSGHGLGFRGPNAAETSPTNRGIFRVWKLKGPEPMLHDSKSYPLKPDNRIYMVDLLAKKIAEGTNEVGDLQIQLQRPAAIKRWEHFGWSFRLTAIGGGVIPVKDDDYLNEAPAGGYHPSFTVAALATDPKWLSYSEPSLYLKTRDGKVFGHIHLKIYPDAREGSRLEIESFINPSGSRNLEFDPSRQVQPAAKP